MLYATGLVAGGSLAGIAIAMLIGFGGNIARVLDLGKSYWEKLPSLGILGVGDVIGYAAFGGLCLLLMRNAKAKDV